MSREEALTILVAQGYCASNALRCEDCPVYDGDDTKCDFSSSTIAEAVRIIEKEL